MNGWTAEQWMLILGGSTTVIAAIAAAAVKIIVALQGVENKVDALEVKVDGRLTQLLERTALASRAEGVTVGRGEMALAPADAAQPVPVVPVGRVVPVDPEGDELVIGIPTPMPPVLLVPVESEEKPAKEDP